MANDEVKLHSDALEESNSRIAALDKAKEEAMNQV